jgi:C-terminal processing protease CtpA/Prc
MRIIFTFLVVLATLSISSQELAKRELPTNFGFEILQNDDTPEGWNNYGGGDYTVGIDKEVYRSGAASATIESTGDNGDFWAWGLRFPVTFGGSRAKLTGYIKTENVTDGYAGLWMRIDPTSQIDNMSGRGVTGTTDWTKYEIELEFDSSATHFVVGGMLPGKGKMWLDDLEVTIDGKTLENAPQRKLTLAQQDTAFNDGSNINVGTLSNQKLKDLALIGNVWGFLKYHHPAIATGDINWDYELFRKMPDILQATSTANRDQKIVNWIDSLGELQACKKCDKTPTEAAIQPDQKWMDDTTLSISLKAKLKEVYSKRHTGRGYYIDVKPNVGNPDFKNENPYADMAYPDQGFRLLALYRYWNMIQYYFPYKDVIDKDWNEVLIEYIPRFLNAKGELEYEIATLQLIGEVQDTHANLWGGGDKLRATKGTKYPPIRVKFIENRLVVVDYFNPEMQPTIGINLGDAITKINGRPTSDIVKEKIPYYPASNDDARFRDIALDILRGSSDSLELEVERDDQAFVKKLPLFDPDKLDMYSWYPVDEDTPSYKMLPNNIGYITLANIEQSDVEKIKKEFINCTGIIIDIRNYPSAFMPFTLGSFIAPKNTEFVRFTSVNLDNPGQFIMGKPLSTGGRNTSKLFKGAVVVLVDELSQSQAEYTAMAFRAAPNTTVVGSTTAGADGNVSPIMLPGGLRTMISGIGVFYPDGSPTQKVGIVPDIEVRPTIKGVQEGRDEVLEKAVSLIKEFKD